VEEAGIEVKLCGILRVEVSAKHKYARMRVVFYAQPLSKEKKHVTPKSTPDYESKRAGMYVPTLTG